MSYRQHWICLTLVEVTDLLGHRYTGGVKQYMPCRIQPSFPTVSCDVKQYIPCMHACMMQWAIPFNWHNMHVY